MVKILKPYTIIPSDLYVQRDADRQIRNIIEDMGRPGYVLVSRQMGKTNLLLNAKRKLETPDDVFVYVDLSNPFDSAKSCFENIIDIALETNPEKFEAVEKTILERRKDLSETPPHKQHTNELRLLLRSISGKLVIILDEIDALTKTKYSDQIFAQIRSIYFSRVNFKELEKLTYILSGVIEPTEIIKDPKISPFNIGQKIFLNDFNRYEFDKFLENSKLNLKENLRDRIFHWTNGNPRMTWDVCSEVENQSKRLELNEQDIDKIVADIYLTTFDNPPIDNIREIVKKDREIRNAIVEIEYHKGKEVSDKVKSKLYLSGIINYEENEIHIKNEIIKECLNLDWIRSIELEEKGTIGLAFENFEKGQYSEALAYLESYLEQNEFPDESKDLCYYYLGYSTYMQGNPSKALDYYNKAAFDIEDSPKFYFGNENLKGLAYKALKDYNRSQECYKNVISKSAKDDNYLRATLSLGHLYMNKLVGDLTGEAIIMFESIINEKIPLSKKISEKTLNYYKCVAGYNLSDIYKSKNMFDEAKKWIAEVLPKSNNELRASLMLQLAEVTTEEEDRIHILIELIDFVTIHNIENTDPTPDKEQDLGSVKLRDILLALFITNKVTFNTVIKERTKLLTSKSRGELLYEMAVQAIEKGKWEYGSQLLDELVDEVLTLEPVTHYNAMKLIAYFADSDVALDRKIAYITLFEKEQLSSIDYIDMDIFAYVIYALTERKKYKDALSYVELINSVKEAVAESISINYLVIYHLELNLYFYLNQRQKAIAKAEEIISLANDEKIKSQNSNLLGDTGLDIIKNNAQSILTPTASDQTPRRTKKTYSRNQTVKVRYKDGTTLETKFKKVENDLQKGECYILN